MRKGGPGAAFKRTSRHCPKTLQGELHGRLRLIFDAPDMETARRLLKRKDRGLWRNVTPKAVERLKADFEEAMAVMALPERYRKRLRTRFKLHLPGYRHYSPPSAVFPC
ncbi:MAG: transposase [Actinomycetota bacterium]|nr:transposase [Actinomycetota bacterium]